MEINEKKVKDITVLALSGRLDTLSSGMLDEKLKEIINNNVNKISIDFSELDFISSSGLRVLLTTAKKVKSSNGRLALSTLKEQVKEVFDVAGFTMLFSIFPSQQDALNSIQ